MSGERLRILHLTDLHLRQSLPGTAQQPKRLSRDMPDILCCLGDRLDEWSPNLIALTGDLLDVPDEVVDGRLAKEDPEANAAAARRRYPIRAPAHPHRRRSPRR